jgi:hypothetical protein
VKAGTESRGKTITALVLMVVAVLALVWGLWPSSSSGSSSGTKAPSTRRDAENAALGEQPAAAPRAKNKSSSLLTQTIDPRLRLDLLNASENTKYEGKGRNIFRAEAEPQEIAQAKQTPIIAPPQPTGPPPPPPINMVFFGFASRPGEAKRVFLSQNGDVFVAGEGDIVNRRYKIIHINPTSIEVEDVLSNNRQSIPLRQS